MSLAIEHLNQLSQRHLSEDERQESVGLGLTPVGLWVPTENVLVFQQELPKVSRRKQQDMLPWLLEDRLLSPPEDFEYTLGPQIEGDTYLVYVVQKATLGQWVLLAEGAAVEPVKMVPDFLALPYEDGRWTIYTEKGRLLVRTGVYEGFAADLTFGWQQLALLRAQSDKKIRFSHLATADTQVPESLAEDVDTESGQINWSFTELPLGMDILPPSYRPRRTHSMAAWIPAMVASALLVVLCLSYMLIQTWSWQRDALVLEEGIAQTYESLFAEKLSGGASGQSMHASKMAKQRLALMEQQYISSQTTPLAELGAIDRIFSTCSDCVLMGISQTDAGLDIRLKDNERLKSRLDGLEGWSANWQAGQIEKGTGTDAVSLLSIRRGSP